MERGGYLESVGPEGLRILFGLPEANKNHAADACRIALELKARLGAIARECEGLLGVRCRDHVVPGVLADSVDDPADRLLVFADEDGFTDFV